jgi:endoglucanase
MRTESLHFLETLLNTPSPSSGEAAGQRLWMSYIKQFADEVESDAYGNCVAVLNPNGSPKIMIEGHADEIGFMVQYIDENGFIYFGQVGGPDPAVARGQRVHIHTAKGPVLGAIGTLAIHMKDRGKKEEVPDWSDIYIDIGAANRKEAEKRVSVGDLITYTVGCQQLYGDIYIARACDNRVGTFTAAETMRLCAEQKKKLKACVIATSSVQEENGLLGAAMVGYSVPADLAVVTDVAHATDIPGTNKKKYGEIKLGGGPILNRGSVNHPVVVERLERVAQKNKIAFQRGIDSRYAGNDADEIFKARGGVPTAAIGIPNRYMHSPVEAIHLKDLETLSRWLALFCLDIKPGEKFKTRI